MSMILFSINSDSKTSYRCRFSESSSGSSPSLSGSSDEESDISDLSDARNSNYNNKRHHPHSGSGSHSRRSRDSNFNANANFNSNINLLGRDSLEPRDPRQQAAEDELAREQHLSSGAALLEEHLKDRIDEVS